MSNEIKTRIIVISLLLLFFNACLWITTVLITKNYPFFIGLFTIAYGLGLRHAVDADHIAAIDNTTRKLIHEGKKPVATGLFFSLGHSTIVFILSLLLVFFSAFIQHNLPVFRQTGSLIGTAISSLFLLLIGIANTIVFIDLFKLWFSTRKQKKYSDSIFHQHLEKRGFVTKILKPFLKSVNASWKMFFIGLLFGLGFDTASEIGLLSLSATTVTTAMPVIMIMLLPLSFTAGMTTVDTLDGICMLGAYGWASINPMTKLYYNLIIVFISIAVALFIGSIEGLQILNSEINLPFDRLYEITTINLNNFGFVIIGVFVISWISAFIFIKIKSYLKTLVN